MKTGDLVAHRFEILELAGEGGMGEVFRALDRQTGEPVALKTIHGRHRDEDRFEREALVLAELHHPGIVGYVTHGVTDQGKPFLVMEWLSGIDLETYLADRGALTVRESLLIARQIAEALGAAHDRGVVHRDIKPSNLYLADGHSDRIRILDFGVARLAHAVSTQSGLVVGTPGYMAPEQARGDSRVDARADVFSLGCVLFECLTGRPAFLADHVMALLAKILLEDAPRVMSLRPDVLPSLDRLVARMLAKDPRARPLSGHEVIDELDRLADTGTLRPAVIPELTQEWLTKGEQRLLCVLTVGVPLGEAVRAAMAQTMAPGQQDEEDDPASGTVEAHGGRLERLADGSRVIVFTGTGAATDQVARAAKCALVLSREFVDAQLALATGRGVVSGSLPVGEVIERAVKLLRVAQMTTQAEDGVGGAGQPVRIDEVTAGLLDARFEVRGDGHGLVLIGERDISEGARPLLGHATPCVGREVELATLQAAFGECLDDGLARVVLVSSAPGMGKSRLRQEFLRRVVARGDPVEVWVARGDPLSAGSAFGLLAQVVRRAAGLLEGEPLEVRERKLRARVSRHVEGADVERLVDFLGELAGVPWPEDRSLQLKAARHNPQLKGDQLRRAWEDFLEAECEAQPVLLVLEDLQWGDLPTISFLDSALRRLADLPFMLLALARPEIDEQFPALWEERAVTHIRLGPLSKRACARLIESVLGKRVDAQLHERITQRAEGNAFYLEELIRSVAEGRADELPETVLAMVQARLEALPAPTRRFLRAGSVFGQTFTKSGVLALLGASEALDVELRVDELLRLELVSRLPIAQANEEDTYLFHHGLVREASYATLTEEDRRTGHRLAAQWLEHEGQGDAMSLAEHYARGNVPLRAGYWYRRAAEQALFGNDLEGAIQRADLGVSLGADPDDYVGLRLVQADAHLWKGDLARAERAVDDVLGRVAARSPAWCEAVGIGAMASGLAGRTERLVSLAYELESVLADHDVDVPLGVAIARVARRLLLAGQRELADVLISRLDGAVAILATDEALVAQLWQLKAQRANLAGDSETKLRAMETAAMAFEQIGDLRSLCSVHGNLGDAYTDLGLHDVAERTLREARHLAQRLGIPGTGALAAHNLGLVLARQGRLEEACQVELTAIEEYVRLARPRMEGASRIYASLIFRAAGDQEGAEREARAALEVLPATAPLRCYGLAALAAVHLDRGEVEPALRQSTDAIRLLSSLGQIDAGEAMVRLVHAEALHRAHQTAHAVEAISLARERLLARGAGIRDVELKKAFLQHVPEHARTLTLAREWAGPYHPPAEDPPAPT